MTNFIMILHTLYNSITTYKIMILIELLTLYYELLSDMKLKCVCSFNS